MNNKRALEKKVTSTKQKKKWAQSVTSIEQKISAKDNKIKFQLNLKTEGPTNILIDFKHFSLQSNENKRIVAGMFITICKLVSLTE